jgi:PAS domain S-box-containing protein
LQSLEDEVNERSECHLSDEQLYEEVFLAAPDGILVVSEGGRIERTNPRLREMFGYDAGELEDQPVEVLVPLDQQVGHASHRQSFTRDPHMRPMGAGLELSGSCKDGSQIPIEVSLSPFRANGRQCTIAVVRDVAERRRLRAFSTESVHAAENERKRIAAELHDETAQRLAAILVRLRLLATTREDERADAIESLRDQVADTAEGVRRIARGLRPPELEDVGVVSALRAWLRTWPQGERVGVEIYAEQVDRILSPDQRLVLYRVVQEALSNVVRHADARAVRLEISEDDGHVVTVVADDGVGFDEQRVVRQEHGLGILGMGERAAMVGGRVQVTSTVGQGTEVRLLIPIEEGDE